MAFDGRSAREKTLLEVFKLVGRVEEPDSLKSKDFLIISCMVSISSLCLVCTDAMVVAMKEVTALEIECYIAGSIGGGNMLELSFWNWDIASE